MTGPVVLVLRLIALAALYAFLSLALWIMWQEFRRAADASPIHRAPAIRVEVRQRGVGPLVRVFNQPEIILGRDPLSDIPLGDKAVSAQHARLSFHHGQWWVDDLGSTNGTRLNHEKLAGSTVLTSGDEIKCGSARIYISLPGKRGRSSPEHGGQND